MQFAGFAKAARRLFTGVPVLAGLLACAPAWAQTAEARSWYSQGVQALDERRYADARAAFLQAVSADPAFPGAWLDLAIAAHAEGDTVQAEEFLTILEARFRLPAPIAIGVRSLRQRIQTQRSALSTEWRWRSLFQGGAGYDTNANAGLAATDLTLTFPTGGVILPLSAAQRPQRDSYAVTTVSTEGSRKLGAGQLEATASAKARVNLHQREFDTLEFNAGASYTSPEPLFKGAAGALLPGPWRAGVAVQNLRLGGSGLVNSLAFTGVHAWSHLPCGPQAGVELDFRHFPVAPNLDSRLTWLSGGATCASPWMGSGGRLGLQMRAGWEDARGNYFSSRGRPGGDTRHLELTLTHQWSWVGRNGTHRVEAQAQWAQARDTQGYSSLLASNAHRRLARTAGAVAYTVPLEPAGADGSGWISTLAVQAFRQQSNLEIFRLQGEILQITVQKSW